MHPQEATLQSALHALADPVRRLIIRQVAASPEWTKACGTFDIPVGKSTLSHHFAVLREAGLLEQRDEGTRRVNRLRAAEFGARFPGLLDLVLAEDAEPEDGPGDRPGDGEAADGTDGAG
ncbi:ArsR/SmtB family transcription factor [Microtetraspora fusca]|uniref:ArsR/SmtB family transcription factor n=1 Tax=Microtetraspora fusca TaxID=1997 RepID=A0ABW6VFG4_MICFU